MPTPMLAPMYTVQCAREPSSPPLQNSPTAAAVASLSRYTCSPVASCSAAWTGKPRQGSRVRATRMVPACRSRMPGAATPRPTTRSGSIPVARSRRSTWCATAATTSAGGLDRAPRTRARAITAAAASTTTTTIQSASSCTPTLKRERGFRVSITRGCPPVYLRAPVSWIRPSASRVRTTFEIVPWVSPVRSAISTRLIGPRNRIRSRTSPRLDVSVAAGRLTLRTSILDSGPWHSTRLGHNPRMDAEAAVSRTRPAQFAVVLHRPATEHSNQPFYDSFLAGLEETLDRHGAGVFVQMASSREEEHDTYPRWARERLVDAVVMVDPVPDDPRPAVCASLGIPVVVVGEGVVGAQTSIVEVDNGSAMRTAVNFLVSLGHRVIGRVSGPSELLHTRSRTMAFDAATAAAGVTGWAVEGDYLSRSGAQCTRALLDRDPTPSALIYD